MLNIIDDNFNLHSWKVPAITKGMAVTRLAGLTYVDSGLPCDTFNIIHITDSRSLTEEELHCTVNHFKNKAFPFCIWISKENLSADLNDILTRASLKQQNAEPGMALDLRTYEPVHEAAHSNITIASTPAAVKDFAEVIAANWTPPDENVGKYFALTADTYLDPSHKISLAIYYHEGKPVSVIEIFTSSTETVGFYSLATLSRYRGKGIGSALLKFALNRAKEDGYKNVILQASEDGIGIYKKYGFQLKTQYYEFA